MKTKKKKSRKVETSTLEPRKVLGVVANMRNLFAAILLVFAFLGAFFGVFNWIDGTYAKQKHLQKVKVENDYRWENTVLNGMYSRFCALDNIITFAIDPTKIDPERKIEYNELKSKIKLQEDVVKDLQKKLRE